MIKDSGERTEFSTGAVRDMKRGVGRMDLLPWYGIMEVSKHCEEGAEKYGEHNVDKGIPLHSLCDSAARHLAKFIAGETDEDHLRAAAWNLLWALNQRKTHPELDDLYSHKETESTVVSRYETLEEALHPLTRNEILQRCKEAQDVYAEKESLKKAEENSINVKDNVKEPTAIEPLSKELLLEMNGRFVYLMQAVSFGRPKEDMSDYVELGWVRVKVVEDDIFIVSEDDDQNVVAEVKFDPSWMRCYISNPITKKKE